VPFYRAQRRREVSGSTASAISMALVLGAKCESKLKGRQFGDHGWKMKGSQQESCSVAREVSWRWCTTRWHGQKTSRVGGLAGRGILGRTGELRQT
jgi:hypothetical protein